ncbi:MAG: hypothetical protein PHT30_03915 [Bacilli bacterium]|nr:hypothetical protein [Bacilli bacterium]
MDKIMTILTDSKISKDDEHIRIGFYANIGYFIHISQMLEYNLRKLICYFKSVEEIESGEITKERVDEIHKKYDEYYLRTYKDKYTLGKLKDEVSKLNVLKPEVIAIFKEINDYRTKVVHMIFQNNITCNELEQSDKVLDYIMQRLVPMSNKVTDTNSLVLKCIEAYQEDFRKYKNYKA